MVAKKHQHLLNVDRALLFQSHLPIVFWGECVLTTAYLINRIPSHTFSWQTFFFRLHGYNADYQSLRVFGCLCFASTLSKFHPWAILSVFVGYPPGMKGFLFTMSLMQIRSDIFPDLVIPKSFYYFGIPDGVSHPTEALSCD